MLRTILYFIYFIIPWILTPLSIAPFPLLKFLRLKKAAYSYLKFISSAFSKQLVWMAGGRVTISGQENLPSRRDICFISNHQSYMDIPLIAGYLPILTGFVAKIELYKVPMLGLWMNALGCVKLERGKARAAIIAMKEGVERISGGHPLVIFPEGTRSKSKQAGKFKAGSIKLATRARAIIVPLTVNGTYRLFEETGRIKSSAITLIIHPPIETDKLSEEEMAELPDILYSRITKPLEDL